MIFRNVRVIIAERFRVVQCASADPVPLLWVSFGFIHNDNCKMCGVVPAILARETLALSRCIPLALGFARVHEVEICA